MKSLVFAAALMFAGTGMASAQTDPNGPNVPPGDGITMKGNNPEGQACSPPGYNVGMGGYPPCAAMPGAQAGMENYPPCTRRNADRCRQTYERGVN